MKSVVFIILAMVCVLTSCTNKKSNDSSIIYDVSIVYDTIKTIGNNSTYLQYFSAKQINEKVLVCFKYSNNNRIHFINYIEGKKSENYYHEISSSIMEADKYGETSSFDIINGDSLLLFQTHRISIYNPKLDSLCYEYLHSSYDTSSRFLLDHAQGIYYNQPNKSFRTYLVRYDDWETKKFDMDSEFSCEVSLLNNKMLIHKAKFPSEYKTKLKYHPCAIMYVANNKGEYVAASGVSNNLLFWNSQDDSVKEVSLELNNFKEVIAVHKDDLRKKDILLRKQELTGNVTNLIYNPYLDLYMRFFEVKMSEYSKDGFKSNGNDKLVGLNLFSFDTENNTEIIIGKLKELSATSRYFPTKNGVYFLNRTTSNEIVIGIITLKKKK